MLLPEIRNAGEKALELLRQGWTQGTAVRREEGKTAYCMLGANHQVTLALLDTSGYYGDEAGSISNVYTELAHRLARMIREQYPELVKNRPHADSGELVVYFNDLPGRTQDQVVAIYEKLLAGE